MAEADGQIESTRTAVLYLRVSTKDQAKKGGEEEGFSIPAQREAGRRKAASLGALITDEFVDAGESARSADRPELKRMLSYLQQGRIDFVIVHKVDRLARNRADDLEITLAIRASGAQLVSCTENIDDTPSGVLLHGIMSSIAEFYSRNLAHEVAKGLVQKAKSGGTPGKAPVGYLNTRRYESGREIRTIEVDPVRAPLVQWAFDAYAGGEWRVEPLTAELNRRGLDVPATRSKPVTPLGVSRLHAMLRNPYYKGIVTYRGVEYEGSHEPLIDVATWRRVQDVLTAHNHAGEKQRRHTHYLKSSLYCGRCGSRMIVTHSRSQTGRVYAYFTCIAKHQKRNGCRMRAVAMHRVEELVAEHYASIKLPGEFREILEPRLRHDLVEHYAEARTQHERLAKKRSRLIDERTKLLEAHYAGAIPIDLLRTEQQRISRELDSIAAKITETEDHQALVETNLTRALDLASDCHEAYDSAPPMIRRRFNQVFFKKLYIEDETVRSELAPAFALITQASRTTTESGVDWSAWEASFNTNDPGTEVHGVASVKELVLVAGAGFEPATSGL